MAQQGYARFINSRWFMGVGLVIYASTLVLGLAQKQWGLVVISGLALAVWGWRFATGRPMVRTRKALSREDAIAELYPKRRRYLVGTSVAVVVTATLGTLYLLGGVRSEETGAIVLGALFVFVAAMLVVLTVRIGLVLRAHGRQD